MEKLSVFVRLHLRGRPAMQSMRALQRAQQFYHNYVALGPGATVVNLTTTSRPIGPTLQEVERDERALERAGRSAVRHFCAGGCGYPVPFAGAYCAECLCEEDGT